MVATKACKECGGGMEGRHGSALYCGKCAAARTGIFRPVKDLGPPPAPATLRDSNGRCGKCGGWIQHDVLLEEDTCRSCGRTAASVGT